jgi:hypothetical protein
MADMGNAVGVSGARRCAGRGNLRRPVSRGCQAIGDGFEQGGRLERLLQAGNRRL